MPKPAEPPHTLQIPSGWIGYVLWEGLPILLVFGLFALISVVNWDYEAKLFVLDEDAPVKSEVYLGPLIFATAIGFTLLGSAFLFWARLKDRPSHGLRIWRMTMVVVLFVLPGMFLILLGPAAISIMESMRQVSQ